MKKLIILLLLCISCNAQPKYAFVTVGVDVKNALVGSAPTNNKSALDGQIKVGATYNNFEMIMQYESFNKIDFQQFGFATNYVVYPLYRVDLAFGLEIRYDLFDRWNVGIQFNVKSRPDIEALYNTGKNEFRASNFINIRYKLN